MKNMTWNISVQSASHHDGLTLQFAHGKIDRTCSGHRQQLRNWGLLPRKGGSAEVGRSPLNNNCNAPWDSRDATGGRGGVPCTRHGAQHCVLARRIAADVADVALPHTPHIFPRGATEMTVVTLLPRLVLATTGIVMLLPGFCKVYCHVSCVVKCFCHV